MSAEIKLGYKMTEVGVIPEDWDVKLLSQIGNPVRGGSPRPAGDPRYFNGSFIPWLTVASLTGIPDSKLSVEETASFLTEAGSVRSRLLQPGSLIIANSGATLGIAKILQIKCCANDGIAALLDLDSDTDPIYIAYHINSKTEHLRKVVATGNGQPNLNTELIGNIAIPIPSTREEQQAISCALSNIDELICGLEQLITKKRDIKQATMQQLLTGQKRLPGFSGEWSKLPFGEIARPRGARVDPRRQGAQEFCIELEHLESGTGRLLGSTTANENASLKTTFQVGDVLFGKLRAYLRKFWLADRPGVCSTEIWALEPVATLVTADYLKQIVMGDLFIEAASNAHGTHMPRSDWHVVKNLEILLPAIEEQNAIATILSDMDSELAAIEARRDKARQLKQGMMQELLTGRIRLV